MKKDAHSIYGLFAANRKALLASAAVTLGIATAGDVRAEILRVVTLENGQEVSHELVFEPELGQTYYRINELDISQFPAEAKDPLSPFAVEDKIDGAILPVAHYAATRGGEVQSVSVFDENGTKKYDILSANGTLGEVPSGGIFQSSDKAGLADRIYVTLADERGNEPASDPIQARIRNAINQSIQDSGSDTASGGSGSSGGSSGSSGGGSGSQGSGSS